MNTCSSCGAAVEAGARFCAACGKPVAAMAQPSVTSATSAAVVATAAGASGAGAGGISDAVKVRIHDNPFTWVFHQKGWLKSVWILLIGWFFTPLPMTLSFGWMIDAIGRRARGDAERLPRARDLLHMVRDGLVVWLALVLIFVIPLMFFAVAFAWDNQFVWDKIVAWLLGGILNPIIPIYDEIAQFVNAVTFGAFGTLPVFEQLEHVTLLQLIQELVVAILSLALIYVVYLAFATLAFLGGTVRFASSRKTGDYLHVFRNFSVAMAHLWRFAVVLLLLGLLVFVSGWLAASVVGSILVVTFGVWITADIIGRLGARLKELKTD